MYCILFVFSLDEKKNLHNKGSLHPHHIIFYINSYFMHETHCSSQYIDIGNEISYKADSSVVS